MLLFPHVLPLFHEIDFLQEVPFDPFQIFLSKGEEIIMSSRLWTSGYTLLQPTMGVIGHEYGYKLRERQSNKEDHNTQLIFHWEDDKKDFLGHYSLYNPLKSLLYQRVKHVLQYPESDRDMIQIKSLLKGIENYGLGTVSAMLSLQRYMEFAGLDLMSRKSTKNLCGTESGNKVNIEPS